jgi:hypothetical protein
VTDYAKLIRDEDPYRALIQGDQAQALQGAMAGAVNTQPDVEAKLRQLSKQVGVPLDSVRLDPPQAERRAAIGSIDYGRMVRDNPITANFLTEQAAVARDDVGTLTRIERAFTAFGQGISKGSLQEDLGPLHYKAMVGTITPAEQARRKQLSDEMKALDALPEKGDSPLSWFLNVTGYTGRQMVTSVTQAAPGALAGATAGAAVGGLAAPVAPVTATGGAILGARAGYITMSTVYNYKTEAGFAFDEFEGLKDVNGKPMPRDVAQGAAAAVGLLNAGLETVGELALLKLVPGLDKLMAGGSKQAIKALLQRPTFRAAIADAGKRWMKAASIEGLTEGLQEITVILGRELAQGVTPGQQFPATPIERDVERVLQATAEGAAGAAGVGAPATGVRAGMNIREVRIAQRNQDFMTALGESAQASKLRERLPEVFRDFVKKAREGGPVENVYIPADQFARYFQSQNVDPAAVAAEVGAANFAEAAAAGTDVVIPLENYAEKLAATQHHAGLMQDVKLHQGDLTMREAKAMEQRQQELQAELEAMIDAESGQVATPVIEQLKQEVMGELVGRFERSTAEAYATTYAKSIATLAQRAGVDPMELHRTYGLRVVTPLPDILQQQPNIDTALDPLLDRLRAADIPTEAAAFGPSLFEFIRDRGGLQPVGETKAMDENVSRRAFQKKITQANGMSLDTAMEAAVEAGYFMQRGDEMLGETELLDALAEDVTGNRQFSPQFRNEQAAALREQLTALAQFIEQMGGDVANMDNAALKALILKASEQTGEDGQQFDQAAVERLQMVAERGQREMGSRSIISAEERAAIAASAKATGLPVSEIEAAVRAHKLAHPVAQGWEPLVYVRTLVEDGKAQHQYKNVPYGFSADPEGKQLEAGSANYARRANAAAKAMVEEVRKVFRRAAAGDKNAQNILAQAGWYKAMRARLRKEFGGLGDLFADLLGATSPNTPVRDNWFNAVDALRRASRGDFDELIPQWEAWADKVEATETDLRAWVNENLARLTAEEQATEPDRQKRLAEIDDAVAAARKEYETRRLAEEQDNPTGFRKEKDGTVTTEPKAKTVGEIRTEQGWKDLNRNADKKAIRDEASKYSKRALLTSEEFEQRLAEVRAAREIPENLLPTKESGAKYGFNGKNVIRAMVDLWRIVKDADPDIARGGTAPKALNFSGNLIGFRERATIDVWAARMLQRLTGGRRIPSMAESTVSGEMRQDASTTLQFGFGQEVFNKAADAIRNDAELKTDSTLANINDDDLQAVVWFVEKELWTVNDWTNAAGEGGSFELEANLTGTSQQARVKELRTIIDASPPSADVTTAAQDTTAARQAIEEHERKYAAEIEELRKLTSGEIEPYKGSRKRMEELQKLVRPPAEAVKLLAAVERARGKLEEFNARKVAAKAELAALEREVDRFVGGLSIQMSMDTQGVDFVPANADMARLAEAIRRSIYEADNGAMVLGSKAVSTEGRYGGVERSLDLEVVAREGYDANKLWLEMLRQAQAAKQDSTFLSRVLRENEQVDPLRHRPGVEIYFRSAAAQAQLEKLLADLAKEGVEFLTVIVDGRRMADARSGAMPAAVGVRLQYVPEFEQRYGMDSLNGLDDAALAARMQEKADELDALAARVSASVEGVSFAGQFWYDTQVAFSHQYQEKIDAIATGTPEGQAAQAGGQVWTGQPIRSGLESADRQSGETAVGEPGADVLGGDAQRAGDQGDVKLFQADSGDKRGFIQFGADRKFTIGLLEKADLSTFLHESGHFWLEVLGDLAERADATEQIKADYQTLLDWFGVKSRAEITVEHHEKFARANEAYLMEGKAPSAELRGIFQRFRAWLSLIYRSMKSLNVQLNDDVRGVLDRIYATDEEIEAAKRQLDAAPLFSTAAEAGMTEGEFAAYRKTVEAASEAAKEKLQGELMREYQRAREKWWKEQRAAMRLDVEAEVDATPVYVAFKALADGKLPDGTPIKLDKADLVRRYGEEYLKRLPRGFQRIYAAEGGTTLDVAAETLGFESGTALVEALVNMRPRKDLIEAETDARMAREYGDMMLDGTIAEEAMQAIHNEERAKIIAAELRALRRQQSLVQPVLAALSREEQQARRTALDLPSVAVFRAAAAGRIGLMQAKDINPHQYLLAERRASKAAYEAAAKKDYVAAATEKQRELMNHYLYLEATKAKQEIDKVYDYMGRFQKAATREKLGKAGADYLDQIDAILERYEFKRVSMAALSKRKSLLEFVEEMESQGLLVNIPDALLDEVRRVNYREATVDELRAVRDTVKNIEHLATLKNKLLRKREAIEFDAVKTELLDSARDNFKPTGELGKPNRKGETVRDKGARLWKWFDAKHLKVEQLVEWLDGGKIDGPWARYLFDQAADAQTREYELHAMVTAKLQELAESMPKEWRESMADKTGISLPGIDGPVTRYTLLSLALNTGNASNLQRLRDGYGWNDAAIASALGELTADDARFVQGVWDTVNSLWPEIVALEKRVTGIAPPKVEATPVTIGGVEVAGGYFPLVYDSRLSAVGEKQAEATESVGQFLANAYGRARTDRGYTKQRVETLKAPVLLDFEQVLTSHLTRVIKDVSHREAIYSLNKILKDGEIKAALIDTVGEEQYRELNKWVQVLVADRADTLHQATGAAKLIMQFRTNMAIVTMGWKISTMMAQFAGFGPSMDLVKPRYLTQALVDFNRYGPWSSHRETLTNMVYEKSGEMKFRADTIERDVRDSLRRMQGDNSPLAAVRKTAFYLTAMADRQVTIPTWLGAYRQGLAEGLTEEAAVRAGDRAVRLSQGAGGTKDLAAVQRDNELMRLLTMYYSPFSVLYARLRDLGHTTRRVEDMPRAVARVMALVILPAVLGDLLAAKGPGDDEDGIWWAIRKALLYPIASIPVVRDLSSYLEARLIAIAGNGEMKFAPSFSLSPVVGAMDKLARITFMRIPEAVQGQRPWDDVAWDTLEASGYVLGLPTAQVRITGEYITDVLTNQAHPETPQQALHDLLFRREQPR